MRTDYKDRVPGTLRKQRRRQRNPWIWVIPLVVIAIGVVAAYRFRGNDDAAAESGSVGDSQSSAPASGPKTVADPVEAKPPVPPAKDRKAALDPKKKKTGPAEKVPEVDLPEPRFTFYKILPEKEVIVSETEIQSRKRDEKVGKGESAASYLIQAGSFQSRDQAEKLKARLADAKVNARMEQVVIDNTSWYRVKIGPYRSLVDAERMRAYLRKRDIDSVLQQSKP
jgi:cell division protein FtsN